MTERTTYIYALRDPSKEFDDHKLVWSGSRVARRLVHQMATA